MSVRSNGSGDNLVATLPAVPSGAFSLGVWVKLISDRNTYSNIVSFQNASVPAGVFNCTTDVDGTTVSYYNSQTGAYNTGGPSLSIGTWYWVVVSRDGSDTVSVRVFDDSTSTTPTGSFTDASETLGSTLDTIVVGETTSGEWADAEFRNVKFHDGVEWSDAECRTESQSAGVQTAGGGNKVAADLQDTDADAAGLNDLEGSNNFANTGFVNGASDPAQMSSADTAAPGVSITPNGPGRPFVASQNGPGSPTTLSE